MQKSPKIDTIAIKSHLNNIEVRMGIITEWPTISSFQESVALDQAIATETEIKYIKHFLLPS